MQPTFPAAGQHCANIFRQIFQIPLVNQSMNLARFFIGVYGSIGVIHDADKAHTPSRETIVQIVLDQLNFTGKSRLCLTQDDIICAPLGSCNQCAKRWAVAVCTGVIIVRQFCHDLPLVRLRVLTQQRFLIANALAVRPFLVAVLLGQAAIDCNPFSHGV